MDDIDDDDFGDLYADVGVQASSAINCVESFARLGMAEKDDGDDDNDNGNVNSDSKGVDRNGDARAEGVLGSEANGYENLAVENGSDSEDDLNIVLDDGGGVGVQGTRKGVDLRSERLEDEQEIEEESGGFEHFTEGGGRGNGGKDRKVLQNLQYQLIRSHLVSIPSHSKGNGSEEFASYSSIPARGDQEFNGYNQHMGSRSVLGQCGLNFSLPRSRTILDVNINTFERKPWRHPGADITDFFNFGFDEESWKLYCKHLDQYRRQSAVSRIPTYGFLTRNEACNSGSEHGMLAQEAASTIIYQHRQGKRVFSPASKISCKEQMQSGVPKGRAIQVEDGSGERQPSMDVRCSRDRDSDVVIQITVQDSEDDYSSCSAKEGLGPLDSSICDVSENQDIQEDTGGDILSLGSASKDELPVRQSGEHGEETDLPVTERCPEQTTVCPVSLNSDKNESVQISDVDRHDCEGVTISDNEGTDEELETSNNPRKRFGRDASCTAPSVLDTESSHGEWSQHSPGSSCSARCSEMFRDGAVVYEGTSYHVKSSSPLANELVTSDPYHLRDSKTHSIKSGKAGDDKYHSRCRSPIREVLRHFDDLDNLLLYNTNRLLDLDHLAVGHGRRKRNLLVCDSYNREDFMYHMESEPSCNYYSENFSDCKIRGASTKYPLWKGQTFDGDMDRCFRRNSDESYYEKGLPDVDGEVMERDWYLYNREFSVRDMGPLTCKESRCLTSKHCSHLDKERGIQGKRKGDRLKFGKRIKNNDYFLERKNNGNFAQENYRRSVPYSDRDRDRSAYKYERCIPYSRREVKIPGNCQRRFGSSYIGSDHFLSAGGDDEYWRCIDYQSNCFHYYEEPPSANGRLWRDNMSARKDFYDRRGRHRKQIWSEKQINDDGRFDNYNEAFGMEESMNDRDHRVRFGRRRHCLRSEALHCSKDEHLRHWDDKSEGSTYLLERTSGHKKIDGKHGSDHLGKLFDNMQVVYDRSNLIREGNSGYQCDRSSNITHRDRYEQTLVRCKDSVDPCLFVGEGKSSGRCSTAGSLLYVDRHDKMDCNIALERKTLKNLNVSHEKKVGQDYNLEFETKQNDEKLPRFSVREHSEALDVEEGQIITEEIKEPAVEKVCAAEDVAHIADLRRLHDESAMEGNMVVERHDNPRILEMIVKMEKRRERFRQPVVLKKDSDRTTKPFVDSVAESVEAKQQRPVRKRRWGGS